jgi:nitrogen regulatory protein P-II 1
MIRLEPSRSTLFGALLEPYFFVSKYQIGFVPKIKIEIVTPENKVTEITNAIISVDITGKMGDGKIFIIPIDETTRIRTGERGEIAV